MEKEDIRGAYTSHDPDQPAHVARPRPQLPQHQPEDAQTTLELAGGSFYPTGGT